MEITYHVFYHDTAGDLEGCCRGFGGNTAARNHWHTRQRDVSLKSVKYEEAGLWTNNCYSVYC